MKNKCCSECPGNCKNKKNTPSQPSTPTYKQPRNTKFTCAQQAAWGKCSKSWMKNKCCRSCGGCSKRGSGNAGGMGSGERNGVREVGDDIPPPNTKFTCAQQAAWGKCDKSWMKGKCCRSCGCSKRGSG